MGRRRSTSLPARIVWRLLLEMNVSCGRLSGLQLAAFQGVRCIGRTARSCSRVKGVFDATSADVRPYEC
jgi:hypothetical protein